MIGDGRRSRVDAQRNAAKIIDAAARLLADGHAATMGEVAQAAGVTRQTVYAHFTSREELLAAVLATVTEQAAAILDATRPDEGEATAALRRWLTAAWGMVDRYPALLSPELAALAPDAALELHRPVTDSLQRILDRGRREGTIVRTVPTAWLLTATLALAHAAAQEVVSRRMAPGAAGRAFRESVLRLSTVGATVT
jgi:AcrR family transcriptional regulator